MDSVVVTSPSSARDRSRDRDRERDRDRDGGRDGDRERERERRPTASLMVCKDHVRGRCSRADCKFAHPLPTHTTQVGEDGKEMVVVCNDSLRGRCARGLVCRYFHPPPHLVTSLAAQVGITPPAALAAAAQLPPAALPPVAAGGFSDFPPYFAPFMPPPLPGGVGGLPGSRVFTRPALEVCRDYMKGRCTREASECRFAHTTPNAGDGNLVTVCQDFLKGRCSREACRYFHPDEHLRSRIQDIAVTRGGGGGGGGGGGAMPFDPAADPLGMAAYYQAYAASLYGADQPSAKKLRMDDGGSGPGVGDHGLGLGFGGYGDDDRVRKTSMDLPYYSGSLSQAYAAAAAAAAAAAMPHGGHPYLPGGGYGAGAGGGGGGGGGADKLPVCRDFMNSKCTRPSCRYVHPDATVQVVDNYVTICRDSIRGRCERPHCRFYHPTNKGE